MFKTIFFALFLSIGTTPKSVNIHITALGDSITKCFNVDCWTETVSKQTNLKITNKGIGGETLEHMNKRLNRDVIKHKPDICIIMGGTNDVFYKNYDADKSMAEIHDMVRKLKDSKIHAVIGIPLPLANKKYDAKLDQLRTLIIQSGYSTIDFYTDFNNTIDLKSILPDGVHPNKAGKLIMANRAIHDLHAILGE